ncbi:MAG: class I SAM-dependent methyltransferase, partial [Pseudomonadota bacterium]
MSSTSDTELHAARGATPEPGRPCPVCREHASRLILTVSQPRKDYWACRICEARFLDPAHRVSLDIEHAHYRHHKNDPYDPKYRAFLSKLFEPLVARLAPGACGLDFGCGPGPALAVMLQEVGFRVSMHDPLFSPNPAVFEQTFDFITSTEVVEHLHDPYEVFSTFDKILRPGGLVAIMTSFQTDDARFEAWYYRQDPTHIVFYRPF